MKIGTKSVLFGAHAFWLHPWFVFAAWWKLYGFPWPPWLWIAFFVHDLGYWGCPNMDGEEGEGHPHFGAGILRRLGAPARYVHEVTFHSRFLAKQYKVPPSLLCRADKLAIALVPWWLYVPMARITGEIREYKGITKHKDDNKWTDESVSWSSDVRWFRHVQAHMRDIVTRNDLEPK